MSRSETSSKKRDAETIHVAESPNAKRTKRSRVSLACAEVSRGFRAYNRRRKSAGYLVVSKSNVKICL